MEVVVVGVVAVVEAVVEVVVAEPCEVQHFKLLLRFMLRHEAASFVG